MARGAYAQAADVDAPDLADIFLGQAKGGLRIAAKFVVTPPGGIGAGFIQEGRREGVIPDNREGIVNLRVIEEVIAQTAVVVCLGRRHPVNCKAGVILPVTSASRRPLYCLKSLLDGILVL